VDFESIGLAIPMKPEHRHPRI